MKQSMLEFAALTCTWYDPQAKLRAGCRNCTAACATPPLKCCTQHDALCKKARLSHRRQSSTSALRCGSMLHKLGAAKLPNHPAAAAAAATTVCVLLPAAAALLHLAAPQAPSTAAILQPHLSEPDAASCCTICPCWHPWRASTICG